MRQMLEANEGRGHSLQYLVPPLHPVMTLTDGHELVVLTPFRHHEATC
jgi:hypothetical protein